MDSVAAGSDYCCEDCSIDHVHSVDVAEPFRFNFEISWEVAHKVGGIHTTLRSKAKVTTAELGENYCMIGLYHESTVKVEVEIIEPDFSVTRETIECLKNHGINVIYGRWLIEGYPKVILFDLDSAFSNIAKWRKKLWDLCHIAIPDDDMESKKVVAFGFLTSWFISEFHSRLPGPTPMIVAHFHEWLSGVGLLLLRLDKVPASTIFTTHATVLGRYLCAGNFDFYNELPFVNVDKEAGDRHIFHKYCIERASAHCAHVFSTASQITADEAEHLLKRKPDIVLPNGLNVFKFNALHEFQNLHTQSKERIHDFVRGHFHGHFDFDLDKTLYLFIAGRYEINNKGVDIFLEALAKLNKYLKMCESDTTIVAFLILPTETNNFNVDSLKGQAITKQLKETVEEIQKQIGKKIYESTLRGITPNTQSLLENKDLIKLKRCILSAQRTNLPPVVTHNVIHEDDSVLKLIRKTKLFNNKDDKVKIVFHPEFLSSTNPLIKMDYEDFVRGCHLGVFPSFYEPWGYTPAECTVLGIPSITTNLSGFGCFMEKKVTDLKGYGIYVLDRRHQNVEESTQQLVEYMIEFTAQSRKERIMQRNRTERLSELLDWNELGKFYQQARCMALEKTHPEYFMKCNKNFTPSLSLKHPIPFSQTSSTSEYSSDNTVDDCYYEDKTDDNDGQQDLGYES